MVTINAANNKTASTGKVLQGQGVGTASDFSTATYPSTATGTGKVLRADGTNWAASTATFPDVATGTGTILRADGTDWVATTSTYPNTNAVNTLLYASASNVMGALATANSGVLTTNSSGVPSIDTTNFVRQTTGMQMKGNNTNTAPPAGFIGEQIRSYVTGISVSNNTPLNITSISLTAGIWDVSCVVSYAGNITGTTFEAGISTTSADRGSLGDNNFKTPYPPISASQNCLSIPSYRITLSATTTTYLVGYALFTVGTLIAGGRISATRVG